MASTTTAAREHVNEIRKTKFSIGGKANPLTEDLHQAVKNLSAELYAKDVHFLMELIQNAEDNEYPEGVVPSLEFVITSTDITNTGAPATLLVFNNEKGCSDKNVESICSVGRSTKKGLRKRGYIGEKDDVFTPASGTNKLMAADSVCISWLHNCNTEFRNSIGNFFLPKATQEAIRSCSQKSTLVKWLRDEMKIKFVRVCEYAKLVSHSLNNDHKLVVTYAHFLHNSFKKEYLGKHEVEELCIDIPIVDNYGNVTKIRSGVLVPAKGSRWVELIGSNPWRQHNYVELGEDYTRGGCYFGMVTSGEEIVSFLQKYVGASDVPYLSPPNAAIPTLSSPLTKRNAFLLLEWLHKLRTSRDGLPERFLSSIENGSWLKISSSGNPGYCPPSESFMLKSSIGNLLQNGSVLVDIPLVDEKFYGVELKNYEDELKKIGVRFQNTEACEFIGKRLMSLAASSQLTRDNVFSILKFIQYLGVHYISTRELIESIRKEKWLRTSRGVTTPTNCVLFSQEWNAASQITDIPFLDRDYYGSEMLSFKKELDLLGVGVKFNGNYQLVSDKLKSSYSLTSLSSEALLLILNCKLGLQFYGCPSECFLSNPESEWGCLLKVFGSFPVLDEKFYGRSIFSMSNELKKIGVMVDFEDASKEFTRTFKQQASISSIKKEHVLSFLQCYGKLRKLKVKFPSELKKCIREEKWLKTRLGDYRSPNECILFGKDWEPVIPISLLPFIDDSNNFYGIGIHDYHAELKDLGVVTDFKDGAKFVASRLFLPQDCSSLTALNVFALLDSVKKLKESRTDFPDGFLEKVSKKSWLKTHFGYRRPDECLLFNSLHDSFLKCNDGPFIDEGFYGSHIVSYKDELNALGVTNETNKEC
ncbi:unnamed protein product [Lactuca saligna]|uniref:Uncharacterized protein n=1 Tax=Lactuca saligna TaxID=75948 RepID=A0AA35Z0K4_LACSI|nr:unnamed protein product [Lactuca saligna]